MYGPARATAVKCQCHRLGAYTTAVSFLVALGSKVQDQGVGRAHVSWSSPWRTWDLLCVLSLCVCLIRTVDLGLRLILETGQIAQWVRAMLLHELMPHMLEDLSLNPQHPCKNNAYTYTCNSKTGGVRGRRITGV